MTMKGYGMCQMKVKAPLHRSSYMHQQSGVGSPQVSGPHLSFSYPVPPYMCLRMIVRKEIVFMPRARTLMDMLKRFEWRDLVARHSWGISSSRHTARNNIPIAHLPGWDQKVMLTRGDKTSSEDAHSQSITRGYRESERMSHIDDSGEESSVIDPSTLKFQHSNQYKAIVTDKDGKQLCKKDSTIIAKPVNSNKETLDIHIYSVVGSIPPNLQPTSESPSILEKFLKDDMSRSILEDLVGGSKSLSKLENFLNNSESLSSIESLNEASASQPIMARLWEGSASQSTSRRFAVESLLKDIEALKSLNRLPIALNLSGTNSYLSCGTTPSLTLEEKPTQELKKVVDDANKRFLFWQGVENDKSSFQSVLHPGYYLCTQTGQGVSRLELRNNPELQQAISEFLVSM